MNIKNLAKKLSDFRKRHIQYQEIESPGWLEPVLEHGKYSVHPITGQSFGWRTWKPALVKIGYNVDIGAGSEIFGHFGVIIGDNVQIGGGTMIYSANTINQKFAKVIIGKNACIGANSVILPGSVIKEGQMIKALSVVYYNDRLKKTVVK